MLQHLEIDLSVLKARLEINILKGPASGRTGDKFYVLWGLAEAKIVSQLG